MRGEAEEGTSARSALSRGWAPALGGAVATFVALAVVAAAPVLVAYFGSGRGKPSIGTLARTAGLLYLEFHHVGIAARFTRLGLVPPFVRGSTVSLTVSLALMTATLLGVLLLYIAGRAVGKRCGGSPLARGMHGAKVALPYAMICFLVSLPIRLTASNLGGLGSVSIHPLYLEAFLWPLGIAAVSGFAGGLGWGAEARLARPNLGAGSSPAELGPWARRARGALAGGAAMLALGLGLSFLGLGVLAAIHPAVTRSYFRLAFRGGALRGLALVFLHSLVIPNMSAWVLFPAMGACVGATGGDLSVCALSYAHFPTGPVAGGGIFSRGMTGSALPHLGPPPSGYLLFLLVPLVAVLAGGIWAAKRTPASRIGEAAGVGAAAGVVFTLLAAAVAILAEIMVGVTSGGTAFPRGPAVWVGPDLAAGVLLALAWGVVGGTLGGLLHGLGLPRPARVGPFGEAVP